MAPEAVETEIAGFSVTAVDPSVPNLWTTPLPERLPVGRRAPLSLHQYLDPNHVLPSLEIAFLVWLSNDVKGGGENGTHYRNDGLLNILVILAGLSFFDRDNSQPSTSESTRQDATLGYGVVPLVHVEEKRLDILAGVNDLRIKLRWIPNLSYVPFIFGIAITVTEIQIWKLTSSGITDELPVFQSSLNSPLELMNAVVAIVHCARVLKYYIANHLILQGSCLKYNTWHKRESKSGKSVKLSGDRVLVKYDDTSEYYKMNTFYTETAEVRHIEHRIASDVDRKIFTLQPLGVNRLPNNVPELVGLLVCVATALHGLHSLMFCHTDLRWANIVWVRENVWCLIDCTNHVRVDASVEDRNFASSRCRQDILYEVSPYSIKHDLYQVGMLADYRRDLVNYGLRALIVKCLTGAYNSASDLIQDLEALQLN